MNDSIEKDDIHLKELFVKQHPDGPPQVSNDDTKMEDLLILQSLTEDDPNYKTIEQKYEEEIAFKQVTDLISKRFASNRENEDEDED
jgi:hypothetical protein